MAKQKPTWELRGKELTAYRLGFKDGNESNYFPAELSKAKVTRAAYDRGYADGQKFGDRKGKPYSLAELLKMTRT